MKYENIKRTLKKKISATKQHCRGTGGGPAHDAKLLWYEEQLFVTMQLGIEGLPSVGDSDASVSEYTLDIHQDDVDQENLPLPTSISDIPIVARINSISDIPIVTEDGQPITMEISEEVFPQTSSREPQSAKRWNLSKKRKTITTTEKKNNIEAFQKLAENKNELTTLQRECYNIEKQCKEEEKSVAQELNALRKKVLELEAEIKKEELEELVEERKRKNKMYVLVEQEQKLKIEILKCDLNMKLKESLHC